jgi:spermidine/putrescine transport system ATP-binding protein
VIDATAIELRDVAKQFGGVTAVNQVSMRVRHGEFFTLLGPSGCGKTTCLRLIAGLEFPSNGQILLQGMPVGAFPAYKRNVNTVFQSYALFPHLSVAENVAFGLKMQRLPNVEIAKRVREALTLVQLAHYGDRRPAQLSGGQQQRVALARALVNQPAVLLLDEPLAALDQQLRHEMQFELKRLQEQLGITFLVVTHDQTEALALSDRIAVMHNGRVLQIGTPTDIYERPQCHFVASFVGETNFFDGILTEIGESGTVVTTPAGARLYGTVHGPVAQNSRVTLAVRPEKLRLSVQPPEREQPSTFLPVVIERVTYVGSDTHVAVHANSSHRLTIRLPSHSLSQHWQPGSAAWVSWAACDALVLPSEGVTHAA